MENRGISITGGTVTAGAMAAGDNAVATNNAGSAPAATVEDLRAVLRDLTQMVEGSAAHLEDPQQSVAVARMAEQEAAKETPDKGRLMGFLSVLASGAGAVSGVAAAVSAVETVLHSIL